MPNSIVVAPSRVIKSVELKKTVYMNRLQAAECDNLIAASNLWDLPAADSRVLRKGRPRTPPGPEGSNGTGCHPVPQGCLAIIRRAVPSENDLAMAESQTPHLVLARKWRPERFSELVGQEHVTRTLGEALKRGRIAHAFLFTGIRGVGKTTAARILARCLNCEQGPTAEPCGECAACVEIRAGSSLDVNEIDGATYRKIEDARAII